MDALALIGFLHNELLVRRAVGALMCFTGHEPDAARLGAPVRRLLAAQTP